MQERKPKPSRRKAQNESQDGWEFLLKHERRIRRLCVNAMPFYDSRLIEDLMDVAIDKIPILVARWDSRRGVCLTQYVFTSLRWWLHKRMKRSYAARDRLKRFHASETEANRKHLRTMDGDTLTDQDAVLTICNHLTVEEIALLRMRIIQNLTFAEIGRKIGWKKTKSRLMYYAAITKAQKVARMCDVTDDPK